MEQYIDFVFDGEPGPKGPRFIECENEQGQSISTGEWIEPEEGSEQWRLRVKVLPGIDGVAQRMHSIARKSGFWDPGTAKTPLEEVALWVSECAEAMEEIRDGVPLDRVWYEIKVSPEVLQAGIDDESKEILKKVFGAQSVIQAYGDKAEEGVDYTMPTDEEWEHLVLRGYAKPNGYGVEAADVVIRIMDSLAEKGISLNRMIQLKAGYNQTREYMHGKVL